MLFAKKVARLLVVIVVDTMVPMCGRAFELQRRPVKLRLVDPLAPAIGEVGGVPPRLPSVRMAPSR